MQKKKKNMYKKQLNFNQYFGILTIVRMKKILVLINYLNIFKVKKGYY